METELSIQQVANLTGLSIDTLRYYERIGLIEPVNRAASGHRRYNQADLDWIGLLINLRETGMPIAQMIHFAQLHHRGPATATERLLLLEEHQRSLEQQMQKLELHASALHQKIARKKESLAQRDPASHSAHASGQSNAPVDSFDAEIRATGTNEKGRGTFMERIDGQVALISGASSGEKERLRQERESDENLVPSYLWSKFRTPDRAF